MTLLKVKSSSRTKQPVEVGGDDSSSSQQHVEEADIDFFFSLDGHRHQTLSESTALFLTFIPAIL